jgi:hypothetical protein
MFDIVFPSENEKEFILIAEKLSIKELYLVYDYKKGEDYFFIDEFKNDKVKLKLGLIAKDNEILKAKQVCDFVIAESSDNDQDVLEKFKPNLMFDFENSKLNDKTHYRRSGLNQVLCKIAAENDIIIGFSFNSLLKCTGARRAVLLGRMMQNINICRKYKVKIGVFSFALKPYEMRSGKDLESLGRVLSK